MHSLTLFLLASALALVAADGEYYVPRAYYTIDAEGHASVPVALRRLRRFAYGGPGGQASASASSQANASGGGTANADASSQAVANSYPGYPGGTSSASAKAEANANSNSEFQSGGWRHNAPPPGYPFATGLLDYHHYANSHEAGQSGTFFNAAPPPRGVFSSSSSSMDSEGHVRFDQRSGITH